MFPFQIHIPCLPNPKQNHRAPQLVNWGKETISLPLSPNTLNPYTNSHICLSAVGEWVWKRFAGESFAGVGRWVGEGLRRRIYADPSQSFIRGDLGRSKSFQTWQTTLTTKVIGKMTLPSLELSFPGPYRRTWNSEIWIPLSRSAGFQSKSSSISCFQSQTPWSKLQSTEIFKSAKKKGAFHQH